MISEPNPVCNAKTTDRIVDPQAELRTSGLIWCLDCGVMAGTQAKEAEARTARRAFPADHWAGAGNTINPSYWNHE